MRKLYPQASLHFAGARGDMARALVAQSDVRFDGYHEVLAGPVAGIPRLGQIISALKIGAGVAQSLALAWRLKPEALFLTGGWVGVPMALACWLLRCPIVIYVPDIEPGLMLKVIGRRFAQVIAATTDATAAYYPGRRVEVTGYPLRPEILEADRAAAIEALKLDSQRRTLLVFGGSRGSRSINGATSAIAPELLADGVQILHISGKLDWPQVQAAHAQLAPEQRARYQVFDFLPDIGQAFAAADLVISRAGAATLAEYPQLGLPSILVPYPHAWRYQHVNAEYLVERGAAIQLDDARLETELLPAVRALLGDGERLAAMRRAAEALRQPDGAANIARLLARTAGYPAG